MNKEMLDILACPMDKHHPLELFAAQGGDGAVSEGALFCTECSRFFPIMGGIPVMLPDELRDKKRELEFLGTHAGALPEKITAGAAPWHL